MKYLWHKFCHPRPTWVNLSQWMNGKYWPENHNTASKTLQVGPNTMKWWMTNWPWEIIADCAKSGALPEKLHYRSWQNQKSISSKGLLFFLLGLYVCNSWYGLQHTIENVHVHCKFFLWRWQFLPTINCFWFFSKKQANGRDGRGDNKPPRPPFADDFYDSDFWTLTYLH